MRTSGPVRGQVGDVPLPAGPRNASRRVLGTPSGHVAPVVGWGRHPPRGCPSTHREEKAVKGLVGDTGTHPKGPWGQSEDPLDSQETPPKNHFR